MKEIDDEVALMFFAQIDALQYALHALIKAHPNKAALKKVLIEQAPYLRERHQLRMAQRHIRAEEKAPQMQMLENWIELFQAYAKDD